MVGLTKKKVRTVGDVRFPDLPIVGHQMEIKTTDGKEFLSSQAVDLM